ncbi:hypothetical protein RFI_04064 [Reticulomyxa filosa]|uniref:Uncharacterized protein n=1 Tax=Reticulomyxa filosa TaxID=46433 RepID=X6P604_RETFI|nr:hypothetical protein RFI_04064 [Reticulomyxa filosa]|eukprot:ETO33047.1 hypothetical protein RFI_04064 [Reticulomyxa filosa]
MFFLFIVAMGYKLYRPNLHVGQMRIALCLLLLYAGVCFAKQTCFMFRSYCKFIQLLQFIFRCFLVVGIVALLNALISSVQTVIRSELWRSDLAYSYALLKAHKDLRSSFYLFLMIPIGVYLFYLSLLDWTEEWFVGLVNYDIVEPALLSYMFFHFRPAPHFIHVNGIFGPNI